MLDAARKRESFGLQRGSTSLVPVARATTGSDAVTGACRGDGDATPPALVGAGGDVRVSGGLLAVGERPEFR
jgi:hypothetical protein